MSVVVGSAARAGRGGQRLGEAAGDEQRREDAVGERAQLGDRVLQVAADLVDHRLGVVGVVLDRVLRQAAASRPARPGAAARRRAGCARACAARRRRRRRCAAATRAARRSSWRSSSSDACSAVSSCTLCSANATWRASSVSTRSSSSVNAAPSTVALADDQPEQRAAMGDRRDPGRRGLRARRPGRAARCRATCRPRRRRGRRPLAPSRRPGTDRAGGAAPSPRSRSGRRRRSRSGRCCSCIDLRSVSTSCSSSSSMRDRAGQARAPRAQRLVGREALAVDDTVGALAQPCARRLVRQRGATGRQHREQQQRTFAADRLAAERSQGEHVGHDDQRGQAGERHSVGQQAVDPRLRSLQGAGGDRQRHEPDGRQGDLGSVVGPVGDQRQRTAHEGDLGATTIAHPTHCSRRWSATPTAGSS